MPWAPHHTLALHAGGGLAIGNYPNRGYFYTGGFVNLPLISAYTKGVFQGGFVLRGYPALQFYGEEYQLYNAEYRFPILTVDHGPSTLPIYWGGSAAPFSPTTAGHSPTSMPPSGRTSSIWESAPSCGSS